jgi:DNA-binding transcriptional LysR family regulator
MPGNLTTLPGIIHGAPWRLRFHLFIEAEEGAMAKLPDATHLRQLATVIRCRSYAKAADVLGISQPALSKSVLALERELGVKLLERGRFGAVPTPFGEALARRSDAVDAELRIAREELKSLRNARSGRVRIGCGPAEAIRLLPLAIERLNAKAPGVRVTVLYGLNAALLPMVMHGDVDFSLSSVPSCGRGNDLRQILLHEDRGVVIASPEHPLVRRGRSVSLGEIARERWVLALDEELERRALDEAFIANGMGTLVPAVETTSAVLMKTLVQQSRSLSYVPGELVHWEVERGLLAILNVVGVEWRRLVGVTHRARSHLSPAAEAALDSLRFVAAKI